MKPEAQQIAIAKACKTLACPGCGWEQLECWSHDHKVPDYLNDLNAMHDAEKVLTDNEEQQYQYIALLVGKDWAESWAFTDAAKAIHATASQRAEAFLKCLGLWKDDACPKRPTSDYRNHLSKI